MLLHLYIIGLHLNILSILTCNILYALRLKYTLTRFAFDSAVINEYCIAFTCTRTAD